MKKILLSITLALSLANIMAKDLPSIETEQVSKKKTISEKKEFIKTGLLALAGVALVYTQKNFFMPKKDTSIDRFIEEKIQVPDNLGIHRNQIDVLEIDAKAIKKWNKKDLAYEYLLVSSAVNNLKNDQEPDQEMTVDFLNQFANNQELYDTYRTKITELKELVEVPGQN